MSAQRCPSSSLCLDGPRRLPLPGEMNLVLGCPEALPLSSGVPSPKKPAQIAQFFPLIPLPCPAFLS